MKNPERPEFIPSSDDLTYYREEIAWLKSNDEKNVECARNVKPMSDEEINRLATYRLMSRKRSEKAERRILRFAMYGVTAVLIPFAHMAVYSKLSPADPPCIPHEYSGRAMLERTSNANERMLKLERNGRTKIFYVNQCMQDHGIERPTLNELDMIARGTTEYTHLEAKVVASGDSPDLCSSNVQFRHAESYMHR
jgi:hypothetical protein